MTAPRLRPFGSATTSSRSAIRTSRAKARRGNVSRLSGDAGVRSLRRDRCRYPQVRPNQAEAIRCSTEPEDLNGDVLGDTGCRCRNMDTGWHEGPTLVYLAGYVKKGDYFMAADPYESSPIRPPLVALISERQPGSCSLQRVEEAGQVVDTNAWLDRLWIFVADTVSALAARPTNVFGTPLCPPGLRARGVVRVAARLPSG